MGRDVVEALQFSTAEPVALVREWGVRSPRPAARDQDAGRDGERRDSGLLPRLRRGRRLARRPHPAPLRRRITRGRHRLGTSASMAVNLRLSPEQAEALRCKAELEGRSMQEVARTAIEQYTSDRPARLRAIIERIRTADAELLASRGDGRDSRDRVPLAGRCHRNRRGPHRRCPGQRPPGGLDHAPSPADDGFSARTRIRHSLEKAAALVHTIVRWKPSARRRQQAARAWTADARAFGLLNGHDFPICSCRRSLEAVVIAVAMGSLDGAETASWLSKRLRLSSVSTLAQARRGRTGTEPLALARRATVREDERPCVLVRRPRRHRRLGQLQAAHQARALPAQWAL